MFVKLGTRPTGLLIFTSFLFIFSAATALALPYGKGNYSGCKYSQNCSTENTNGTNGLPSNSTSAQSDQTSQNTDKSLDKPGVATTGDGSVANGFDSEPITASGVHWWRYICLGFAVLLTFWWIVVARRRRKKDDSDTSVKQA